VWRISGGTISWTGYWLTEVHFFGFYLTISSPFRFYSRSGLRELHATSSYLVFLSSSCKYLILRHLLPFSWCACGISLLSCQILPSIWRTKGVVDIMGMCVCVISKTLCYLLCWFCNHLSERKYSLSLFSLFPHLSLPTFRFIRTSWDSMLTTPKQTLHSKSSCGPWRKISPSLHSLYDTSTLLVWRVTDCAAWVFWSQNFLFLFLFILLLIRFRSQA